ncbi:MAG: HAD-IIB family hydrolase [Pseudomonadota bacterium]
MTLVIFTDLDGTLLDHETYSWEPASPALQQLRDHDVPLIMASSKTAAEIAPLRSKTGFEHCPAIVENGAGILPAGALHDGHDAADYRVIRDALVEIPKDLRQHFRGFGDMTVQDIALTTGLPENDAAHAGQRAFSEPGVWSGDDAQRDAFCQALADLGISARYGGRFLTLSLGGTKAGRMRDVLELLDRKDAGTVALGDAPNDIEMLEAADYGFIIANPHGNGIPPLKGEHDGRITRTKAAGPTGWNEAVLSVLSQRTPAPGA